MTASPQSWVIVDLETTGLSPGTGHEIVEIGAVRLEGSYLNGEFQVLVNPGRPIPWQAQQVHGISDTMVADAPPFEAVLPRFLRFAQGAVLISHNARFDRSFLDHACRRVTGEALPHRHVDTLQLARQLLPRPHGLDHLVARLGVGRFREGRDARHRALGDAMATAEVWLKLRAMAEQADISLERCYLN